MEGNGYKTVENDEQLALKKKSERVVRASKCQHWEWITRNDDPRGIVEHLEVKEILPK
jgi:hypothetical protein